MLEKRGGRCRTDRWTDTSPILPDMAHDSRNQGRVVSLSVLSLLPACVLPPAEKITAQLAASADSLVTDAEHSNRRITCLLHIVSDVTRVRHAQGTTLSTLRAFVACAAAVQQRCLSSLARPVWGTVGRCRGVLPRTKARCVVGQKNRETKFTASFDQKLPTMKYIFACFPEFYRKSYLRDNFGGS